MLFSSLSVSFFALFCLCCFFVEARLVSHLFMDSVCANKPDVISLPDAHFLQNNTFFKHNKKNNSFSPRARQNASQLFVAVTVSRLFSSALSATFYRTTHISSSGGKKPCWGWFKTFGIYILCTKAYMLHFNLYGVYIILASLSVSPAALFRGGFSLVTPKKIIYLSLEKKPQNIYNV